MNMFPNLGQWERRVWLYKLFGKGSDLNRGESDQLSSAPSNYRADSL